MTEHTPTPWMAEPNAYGTWFVYRAEITETAPTGLKYRQLVCGGDGYRTLTAENAAFIVKAANNHDALVKALEEAKQALLTLNHGSDSGLSIIRGGRPIRDWIDEALNGVVGPSPHPGASSQPAESNGDRTGGGK